MRRHKLKFGYGPKYLSLEVVVRPDEPGTVSNSYHKTLKTGTDTQTYPNKLPVVSPTPNKNKTSISKVKQLTPIQNEVRELTPIQNKVRELTPIQIKVRELTLLYTSDTEGLEATTDAKTLPLAHTSNQSLTADTDLNTNNNPINGPITYKPKTLPLAHKSHQSLISDTDYSKNHNTKPMYFTLA